MKKTLFTILLFVAIQNIALAQSSIIIEPNPSTAGTLTDLKLNSAGKIVAANDPTKTHYYNASNLDFLPNSTVTSRWNAFVRDHENTRIAYFETTLNESVFMLAPVDLPDGAVITRMRSFYIDNTSAEILFIELIRRQKTTTTIATEDVMASSQSSSANSASVRTVLNTTISNPTIDNEIYHYFIKVKIGDFTGDATQQWRSNLLGIRNVELQYTY
jgi:hypothetical protein